MKNSLRTIMISILAIMFVFVSCNPAVNKTDKLGRVMLTTSGSASRSLTVADPSFEAGALYWKYATQKVDSLDFITGQTATYDEAGSIQVTDGAPGLSGKVGPFSQGLWNFKLFAYTDSNYTKLAWSGEAMNKRIEAGDNRVAVKVSALQSEGKTGSLLIGDIVLKDGSSAHKTMSRDSLTQVIRYWKEGAEDQAVEIKSTSAAWTTGIDDIPSGDYWVEVKYVDTTNPSTVRGYEKKWVHIYDNVTTAIGGFLGEKTGSTELDAQAEVKQAASAPVVVEDDKPTKLEVAATPESGKTGQKTSVAIPAGVLKANNGEAKVDVTTYSAPKANEMFTVTDDSGATALAGIDITLTQTTAGEVKTFNEPVIVTTYIIKGLKPANIGVKYNGEGTQPTFGANDLSQSPGSATGYNPTTGELRFQTDHFSQFYIVDSRAVAYDARTNTAYDNLLAALAVEGGEIHLLKDCVVNGFHSFCNKVSLYLGTHNIAMKDNKSRIDFYSPSCEVYIKGDKGSSISGPCNNGLISTNNGCRVFIEDTELNSSGNYAVQSGHYYAQGKPNPVHAGWDVETSLHLKNCHLVSIYGAIAVNGQDTTGNNILLEDCEITGGMGYLAGKTNTTIKGGHAKNTNKLSVMLYQKTGSLVLDGCIIELTISSGSAWYHSGNGYSENGAAIMIEACGYPGKQPEVTIKKNVEVRPAGEDIGILVIDHRPDAKHNYFRTYTDNIELPYRYIEITGHNSDNDTISITRQNTIAVDTQWYNEDDLEYAIGSAAQLAGLSKLVAEGKDFAGKTIKLTSNIDLGGIAWKPIGSVYRGGASYDDFEYREDTYQGAGKEVFKGSFDGQNHIITGLKPIDPDEDDSVTGLFGCVGGNGSIKNLVIKSGEIVNTGDTAAGLVGYVAGAADETFTIENCKVESEVTVSVPKAYINNGKETRGTVAAGVLGRAYGEGTVKIINCTNAATVTGNSKTAGIVGSCNTKVKLAIEKCTNKGSITDSSQLAAGILCFAQGTTVNLEECINAGTVSAKKHAGGIVGCSAWSAKHLSINSCTNSGEITTKNTGDKKDGEANAILGHNGSKELELTITPTN